MKNVILFFFIIFSLNTYAQSNPDSTAYQYQRKKINDMLAARASKFGQYQQSLTQHTGIFGMQTKKDIRRSNDILMDIAQTDDEVYKQIKVLLNMNTSRQHIVIDSTKELQARAKETENYNIGFMNTINRMRAENEKLKSDLDGAERKQQRTVRDFVIAIALILMSIFLFVRRKYAAKS